MIDDRWLLAFARRQRGMLASARLRMVLAEGGPFAGLMRRSIHHEMMHVERIPDWRYRDPST